MTTLRAFTAATLAGEVLGLGDRITWNFTKFLVGRDWRVIRRYSPTTKLGKIARDIEQALAA